LNKTLQTIKYITADFCASVLSWALFFSYRKIYIEPLKFGFRVPLELDQNLLWGLVLIPVYWICLHTLTGAYFDIYRKSRLKELGQTILITVIGVVVLFFVLLLDDNVANYKSYYRTFALLLCLQFSITFLFRLILTSITQYRIRNRKIGFHTLIIGSNQNAINLFNEFTSRKKSFGYKFVGFVHVREDYDHLLEEHLPHLGHYADLARITIEHKVEEVIIAIESSEHDKIYSILTYLENNGVIIKIIPDMYDIITGAVKMTQIMGTPLIEITPQIMPVWQQIMKRAIDLIVSLIVLTFLLPLFIILAIGVKLSSPGSVFYSHERIGHQGRPFTIFKFRSMVKDAEINGPQLSQKDDSRITKLGKILRRTRLDELPQFYNVLIGNMSIVGPRPERQHFIDKITEKAPHYKHLHKVRPGITSWGQVKYGYAEDVDQMIERLRYDVIYIENMSLAVDFRIMIYTVLIILQGRGQ